MNFFKLYIGDYQRDTAHLSIAEHGAYLMMLQHYYATEKPLPIGKSLHRMLRAQDKVERDAIDSVAAQFWTATDAGLVNERADAELSKASAQCVTNRATAQAREAKRKVARTEHESCYESSNERGTTRTQNQTPDTRLRDNPVGLSVDDGPKAAVNRPTGERPVLALVPDPPPGLPDCPHEALIALYARHLPHLRQPLRWDGNRAAWMRTRWRECSQPSAFGDGYRTQAAGLEFWERFFVYVAATPKLSEGIESRENGHRRVWKPSLDWLVNRENFTKVIEGAYA